MLNLTNASDKKLTVDILTHTGQVTSNGTPAHTMYNTADQAIAREILRRLNEHLMVETKTLSGSTEVVSYINFMNYRQANPQNAPVVIKTFYDNTLDIEFSEDEEKLIAKQYEARMISEAYFPGFTEDEAESLRKLLFPTTEEVAE